MLGLVDRNNSYVSWGKAHARPSIVGEEHAIYLPLVKQASIQERHSMMTQLKRQESFGGAPFEVASDYIRGGTMSTAFSEQVPQPDLFHEKVSGTCSLGSLFEKWMGMYKTAINNKSGFLQAYGSQFYHTFIQDACDFAREMFLDPTQCENPRFALPQLMRENYYQKGLFYRTEKILVHSYSNCFQNYSVDYTRQLLFDINQGMQTRIAQNQHARCVLRSLLEVPSSAAEESLTSNMNFQKPKESQSEKKEPTFPLDSLIPQLPLKNYSSHQIEDLPLPTPAQTFGTKICNPLKIEDNDDFMMSLELPTLSLPTLSKLPMLNMQAPQALGMPSIEEDGEDFDLPCPLPALQPFSFDMSKLQFAPPTFPPLESVFSGKQQPSMQFEMVGLNSNLGIFTQSDELTPLYRDVASYQLRQYLLICEAHSSQLTFLKDQIGMAPSLNKNYYIFLEDYVEKERNLRYLLKKVSQNFIMQDAFQETMLRSNIYQAKETKKQPYLCDFLLLEYLDSIWINEVYREHRLTLSSLLKDEVKAVHTVERFEELSTKKAIFRKVINTIHQTEYSLSSNEPFLSISMERKKKEEGNPTLQRAASESPFRPSQASNASQFGGSVMEEAVPPMKNYDDLKIELMNSVKRLLSQMQKKSNTVQEYMQYCSRYEEFEFQKLEEVEHHYLLCKKQYLGKAFAKEFAIKLENNKMTNPLQPQSDLNQASSDISNCSTTDSLQSGGNQKVSSPASKKMHQDLSLNQILHPELIDSFFHQIIRGLLKNEEFKGLMASDDFMQSLFMIFHIEQSSRSEFASDINKYLIQCHSQLQDLYAAQPELLETLVSQNEEAKNVDSSSVTDSMKGGNNLNLESSVQESYFSEGNVGSLPFSLAIGIGSDEDDDQLMMNCCEIRPSLSRAYSVQKAQVFKGLSSVIFRELLAQESVFDFQKCIEAQREMERKRAIDLIQQRIDSFNMHLQNFSQQQALAQQAAAQAQDSSANQNARDSADVDMQDETLQSQTNDVQSSKGSHNHDEENKIQESSPLPIPFTNNEWPTMQRSSSMQQYKLVNQGWKGFTMNKASPLQGEKGEDDNESFKYDKMPIPQNLSAALSVPSQKPNKVLGGLFFNETSQENQMS